MTLRNWNVGKTIYAADIIIKSEIYEEHPIENKRFIIFLSSVKYVS